MPNGKTHDKITIFFIPILLGILVILGLPLISIIILSISFLIGSFMFNGDLDIHSRPYRRWWLLRWIWLPYQNTFSHRSFFTHGLIIGTLIRLIYVGIIPLIIMIFLGIDFQFLFSKTMLLFYIGLELGSALHTVSDYIWSFFKKY